MKKLLFLCGIFLVISCNKEYNITRSFCYWKTQLYFSDQDSTRIESLKVTHLYVRYFDVGWSAFDKEPRPTATLESWNVNMQAAITPSVFIKNDVLLYSNRTQLEQLAQRIKDRINNVTDDLADNIADAQHYKISGKESDVAKEKKKRGEAVKKRITDIFIDCDWTPKTRDNYFYLLTEIKKILPQYKLSATIRLWQYRDYEQAGIPPADKGLLMCYNMESAEKHDVKNSLATSSELKKYITHDDYSLPLDVALPVFNWSVVFRDCKFKGILSDFGSDGGPEQNPQDFTKKSENRYTFNRDMVIGQTYYRYGDELRVEKTSPAEMEAMIALLKDNIDLENARVTFFSWDKNYIDDYGIKTISGFYSLF